MNCRKSMQIAVNGILTLPDHLPDIDFILRVTSTPIIDHVIVLDKQISFSGHILIYIETVSSKSDCRQTIHFSSFKAPFIGSLEHCCTRANMDVQLNASIKHQEFKLLSCQSINKLIVVKISILKRAKASKTVNRHSFESRVTLLHEIDQSIPPMRLLHTTAPAPAPFYRNDSNDSNEFYLPQKLEASAPVILPKMPCSNCGGNID